MVEIDLTPIKSVDVRRSSGPETQVLHDSTGLTSSAIDIEIRIKWSISVVQQSLVDRTVGFYRSTNSRTKRLLESNTKGLFIK